MVFLLFPLQKAIKQGWIIYYLMTLIGLDPPVLFDM